MKRVDFSFEFHYDSVKEFYIVFEAGNVRTLSSGAFAATETSC